MGEFVTRALLGAQKQAGAAISRAWGNEDNRIEFGGDDEVREARRPKPKVTPGRTQVYNPDQVLRETNADRTVLKPKQQSKMEEASND
ncbi:hypothetical protein FQN53_000937 [Emmonsiellopsis sp. PD_33]|nr:hypothetical protein FQN53_000937 [Emmonsiellopsis sp. PD_33]